MGLPSLLSLQARPLPWLLDEALRLGRLLHPTKNSDDPAFMGVDLYRDSTAAGYGAALRPPGHPEDLLDSCEDAFARSYEEALARLIRMICRALAKNGISRSRHNP